jgi:lipoprotein-anchoring transpeptidase ErfK/SrfK
MNKHLSRRELLKLSGLAAGNLAFSRYFPPGQWEYEPGLVGRVANEGISVFDAPHVNAETVGYKFRDDLLNIYKVETPPTGPAYNPVWYRIWGGYVHSAFVQLVETKMNPLHEDIPAGGMLSELTVPYSRPYEYTSADGWLPTKDFGFYYYQTTHWVTDLVEGPDKHPWYQVTDELWEGYKYYIPAGHLRPFTAEELAPIATDVPASDKRIEVSLYYQVLTAYEGDEVVLRTTISSGVDRPAPDRKLPTNTPLGIHFIESKMPSKNMGVGRRTDTLDDTELPGVPWTMFFAEGGYALHGTYWHNNFGVKMSRGCINMRNDDAKWLFRWSNPVWDLQAVEDTSDWKVIRRGTRVDIVEK